MADDEFSTYTVTCTTTGCENRDIPIAVQVAAGGAVMCGPCGTILLQLTTPLEGA